MVTHMELTGAGSQIARRVTDPANALMTVSVPEQSTVLASPPATHLVRRP